MHHHPDLGLVRRLRLFSSLAAFLCSMIGLSVLIGWALHVPILPTWGATSATVPNTAACFLLAGISQALLRNADSHQPLRPARKLVANGLVAVFSMLSLLSLVTGRNGVVTKEPAVQEETSPNR
jgi:peptidoglycan/LPS O-acetylase OafA/YrhL